MAGWLRRADDGSYDHGTDDTPDPLGAICAAIIARYACVYGHDRATATTYINDNAVVVWVLENILSAHEAPLIAEGSSNEVTGRVAVQTDGEDEFTAAVERLHRRRMTARHAMADRPAITDEQVMVGVKGGSTAAFEALYDRYCDRAYRVARSVCRDVGRAEEAVQEAFISIWRSRSSYDERGNVAAWVLTMVRHRAIDSARRNGPHAAHRASEDLLQTARAPDHVSQQVADRGQARDLLSVIAKLPDAQRDVITLAFYRQLTHPEIAARLDLPLGTVKGRIRLGIERLRGDIDRIAR